MPGVLKNFVNKVDGETETRDSLTLLNKNEDGCVCCGRGIRKSSSHICTPFYKYVDDNIWDLQR